jgi:hypothetical protein
LVPPSCSPSSRFCFCLSFLAAASAPASARRSCFCNALAILLYSETASWLFPLASTRCFYLSLLLAASLLAASAYGATSTCLRCYRPAVQPFRFSSATLLLLPASDCCSLLLLAASALLGATLLLAALVTLLYSEIASRRSLPSLLLHVAFARRLSPRRSYLRRCFPSMLRGAYPFVRPLAASASVCHFLLLLLLLPASARRSCL